jgi:DNA-binding MarR family transcriptional regulator
VTAPARPAASAARDARDAALADELFAAIGMLRRTARRAAGRPWPLEELAGAQLELLRLVRRQSGISVAEAAAELGLMPNTVSTLVRQLVDAGHLIRSADPNDRRVARLSLSPSARQRAQRWRDNRTDLAATAIEALRPSDRAALARAIPALSELASRMERHD